MARKKEREMSESRGCSTSAGNELMKREKGGNSPREGAGRVGAANGIVTVILPCVWKCVCVCVRMCGPGAHVCVWRSTVGISLQ